MPYLPLTIPPGFSKPGTVYDARGRWYDGNLVRWHEGVLRPWGGWTPVQTVAAGVGTDIDLAAPVRGMLAWRDGVQQPNLAMGVPSKLWFFRAGVLTDITPTGFASGTDDATITSGPGPYGSEAYSGGAYGYGVSGAEVLEECSTWQLDQFGEQLIACAQHDGKIYRKSDPSTTAAAAVIATAPTSCRGVVVTPERFVVALGASGDDRLVKWSDQEDPDTWTASSTNQAGDLTLVTPGSIMAGRRVGGETLIWTDYDVWRMRYIGGTLVYSITPIGSACGTLSRHAMAVADGKAFWMGQRGFFVYDGFVKAIPCEVGDHVFGSLNRQQRSKIAAYVRASFGEVVWHYPSEGSAENDRYVAFNYRMGVWTTGELERTSGVDAAAFGFPIAADSTGAVYQHEIVDGDYESLTPYIESGPVEIGAGDRVMMVREIVPDNDTFGSLSMKMYSSTYPVTTETEHGPYTPTAPTKVRLTGRQVRLRVEGARDWRLGTVRLEVVPGGRR